MSPAQTQGQRNWWLGTLGEGTGALESWSFAKGCSGWSSGTPTWQGGPCLAVSWLRARHRQGGQEGSSGVAHRVLRTTSRGFFTDEKEAQGSGGHIQAHSKTAAGGLPQASPLNGPLPCVCTGLHGKAWGVLAQAGVAVAGLLRAYKTPAVL